MVFSWFKKNKKNISITGISEGFKNHLGVSSINSKLSKKNLSPDKYSKGVNNVYSNLLNCCKADKKYVFRKEKYVKNFTKNYQ